MLGNEFRTPVQLFEAVLSSMHSYSNERGYVSQNSIVIEELIAQGKTNVISWLTDDEFKSGLNNNPTSYYFGIAVNVLVSGMYYADVWENNNKYIKDVKYTDIYDGGLWNNILRLIEDKTDEGQIKFKNFLKELYDIWTGYVKSYTKLSNFGEYIIDTMVSFFQIGVCIKLSLFDY